MADRADAAIARESNRRAEPSITEPLCIACDDGRTDGKQELCRSCLKEMAADRRADEDRDEPDARAERLLRLMGESQ